MFTHREKKTFPFRIEVCGGIASGKTTLAKLLRNNGFKPILENFTKNPFLKLFYLAPETYAFETEIMFLLQHYNQIKAHKQGREPIVCDFSFYLDLAYSSVTLCPDKFQAFRTVYDETRRDIDLPDLLIYLQCSASTELQRIRTRNRTFEQSIRLDFLGSLNTALVQYIQEMDSEVKLLEINSDKLDFANDAVIQQMVIALIRNRIEEDGFRTGAF